MLDVLATAILIVCSSNALLTVRNKTFVHFPEHSHVIYLTGVIGDVAGTSLTRCAIHCEKRNCLSFSHSIDTGFCRLHTFKYPECYPSPVTINATSGHTPFYRVDDGGFLNNCTKVHNAEPNKWMHKDNAICPCKLDLTDGSWIVMQQRFDGSVDFRKDWKSYKQGFGNPPGGEFWLGLEEVHQLTTKSKYILVVDLLDKDGVRGCASFDEFSIGPESDGYRLNALKYQGTAGNSLAYHSNNKFSTLDRDNDMRKDSDTSCADEYMGGGNWYNECIVQNLNGLYLQLPNRPESMVWKTFRNFTGLRKSKMLLKKKSEVYNIP